MLRVEPADGRASVAFFADQDGLRIVGDGVHERCRMGGRDDLRPFGRVAQCVGNVIDQIGMKPQFRLVDAEKRRRRRIAEKRQEA